jgi:hypothetical protein
MNFVTGLPVSRDTATNVPYNAILVVVDQFTKQVEYTRSGTITRQYIRLTSLPVE